MSTVCILQLATLVRRGPYSCHQHIALSTNRLRIEYAEHAERTYIAEIAEIDESPNIVTSYTVAIQMALRKIATVRNLRTYLRAREDKLAKLQILRKRLTGETPMSSNDSHKRSVSSLSGKPRK
jgi:hypothetical protein